jgi:hypothetical protein
MMLDLNNGRSCGTIMCSTNLEIHGINRFLADGCERFQVLTAASMMFRAVFWVVLPCKMMMIILHGSIAQKTALNIRWM